jgi:exodeoxyribonuclease VII small subunit
MKREFLDRTNDYTLAPISDANLCPRIHRSGVFWFLDGNRNCVAAIVLKYPVANHPQPLRRPLSTSTSLLQTVYLMASKTPPAAQTASFEDAMAELEQLVARMEAGELPLEASVAAYRRGSELVKFCAGQLDKVDSQVRVLEGDMLKPFAGDDIDTGTDE